MNTWMLAGVAVLGMAVSGMAHAEGEGNGDTFALRTPGQVYAFPPATASVPANEAQGRAVARVMSRDRGVAGTGTTSRNSAG